MSTTTEQEPSPAPDLFSVDLRSYPPRIVELRRRYDEAKAAHDAAAAHEDEPGEEIPPHIQIWLCTAMSQLRAEAARILRLSENEPTIRRAGRSIKKPPVHE